MEQKNEQRQVPKNQDGNKVTSRADGIPTSQPSPGGQSIVALNRPWANRPQTMSSNLQEYGRKTPGHGGNTIDRWTVQPMTDDPYQNMEFIMPPNHPKPTSIQSTKQVSPPSQTAATTGSE
ncbi:hypothetical protein F5Y13DRAFT_188735 [Hypoxylon sp. FL1857]|nr:hypothetical protein F5Y13DRAFT_188735 [Hypoxylon sp. FL1857]